MTSCPTCHGAGEVDTYRCTQCGGIGHMIPIAPTDGMDPESVPAPYTIEVEKPIYKIPNVSNPGTFDLQVIRLSQEGVDRQFRTTHTARIVRTSATRPQWHARTEEPRYRDEVDILTGTLDECRRATIDHFHCIANPPEDNEDTTHYHVVAFINGCLNDYDSGPYDTIEEAREGLSDYIRDGGMQPWHPTEPAGQDRYTNGPYILKIEECNESPCEAEG